MFLNQIKTRIGKRPLMILGIALALVALTAVAVWAIAYDLTYTGAVEKIDEAVYRAYNPASASGSGTFEAFVRISGSKKVVKGYNTSGRPLEFDENSSPNFTRSYKLSNVPIVGDETYPGVYREFQLDINQTSGNALYSLDTVEVYLTTDPTILGYPFVGKATKVYDLDKTTNNWIKLNYSLAGGSGKRDMLLRIPNANFLAATGLGDDLRCVYKGASPAGADCPVYVVLFSQFGQDEATYYGNDDGFEEWGVEIYDLATKSGTKFNDLNNNGVRDANEPGLAGWTIYVDINDNGQQDLGEPFAVTGANGAYTITGIVQGTYKVREVQQEGWICTYPSPCYHEEAFMPGMSYPGNDFGNFMPTPAIDIEKATNGQDADTPTGPFILVGDPVAWTYVVKNIGNEPLQDVVVTDNKGVAVTCPKPTLAVNESMTCTGNGTALEGQYANIGTATATGTLSGKTATDTDPSHYFGAAPAIDVTKSCVAAAFVGQEIEYSFTVTNIGNVPLSNVTVKDSRIGLDEMIANLGVGASQTFTKKYTPTTAGTIVNTVIATGRFGNTTVTDTADCTTMVYEPTVTKTAAGAYNELHEWTVVKTVNPTSQDAFAGDTVSYEWTVTVTEKVTEKDFAVTGVITVTNPAPIAMAVSLADALDDGTVASITACTGGTWASPNLTVPANATAECAYTASPTGKTATKNTATATLFGYKYEGEAPFKWVKTEINPTVTLDDDQNPDFPKTISDGSTWKYKEDYTCSADAKDYTAFKYAFKDDNTAVLKVGDGELNASASTTVNCWMIDVTKDAKTTFKRTWQWTIEKRVTPAAWKLFDGDSGTSGYEIVVTKTGYVDSDWAVSGVITVTNPAPIPAPVNAVVDTLPGSTDFTLNCPWIGGPVPAGGTVTCTYSAKLPDGTDRVNTATVSMPNKIYTATANVTFGAPTTVVNDKITVEDGAMSWEFSASGTAKYDETFTCAGIEYTDNYGWKKYPNTATIVETGQSSSAEVLVECWKLEAKKTAVTSWNRYWDWTIEKTGDQTYLKLMPGEKFLVNYEVTVAATSMDKDFAVKGTITVKNPAPIAAVINSVTDVISPAIAPTLNCGVTFPYTLAALGTLTCNYESALPDAAQRLNTATAVQQNYNYTPAPVMAGTTPYEATAAVIFGATPTDQIDECIDLSDSMYGDLGTVCAGEAPKTFKYSIEVGPYAIEQCGDTLYDFINCASFVTKDTETTGEDCWTVQVEVPCPGCTYTQGYWKTHAGFGPQAMDPGWTDMGDFDGDGVVEGPNEQLFWPGADYTWYKVFTTAPKGGNAWTILAHQFMAAYLNVASGASAPAMVAAAIGEAYTLLQTNNPATFKDWKGTADAKRMIELAGYLDQYNNGYLGVPHCD